MTKNDVTQSLGSQEASVMPAQIIEDKSPARLIELPKEPRALIFDAEWYREKYSDVATAGINPVQHFLNHGAGEGRDPNPFFSTQHYRRKYRDVAVSGMNPFLHYLFYGVREGRESQPPAQVEDIEKRGTVVVGALSEAASSTRALTPRKKPNESSIVKKARASSVKAHRPQATHTLNNNSLV